jgi:hypothetical protein
MPCLAPSGAFERLGRHPDPFGVMSVLSQRHRVMRPWKATDGRPPVEGADLRAFPLSPHERALEFFVLISVRVKFCVN